MNTIKLKLRIGIIASNALLILMLLNSCTNEFLDKEPIGVVATSNLNNENGVEQLLIGAYSLIDGGVVGSSYSASIRNWIWDCASDDSYKGSSTGAYGVAEEVERYETLSTNFLFQEKWESLYDGISRSNDALRALANVQENIGESKTNSFAAQAKFLRALFHFRLQQMHFAVPYISEDITNPELVSNDHPIWDEIEGDLRYAIEYLPEIWPGEPGRPTLYAAQAVLAYVHLHQGDYNAAKPLLDNIINSGKFDLADNFYHNFDVSHENNIESIFEIQYAVNDGSDSGWNGTQDSWVTNPNNPFTPTCCGFYQPSQDLVNAFKVNDDGLPLLGFDGPKYNDENLKNDMGIRSAEHFIPTDHPVDPRLDHTVGRRGIPYFDWGIHTGFDWIRAQGDGGPYNSKKTMFSQEEQPIASHTAFPRATAINYRVYRYAHILLWRAECAVEDNDLELARTLVNQVRRRASDDFVMGKCTTYDFTTGTEIEVDWSQPAANYLLKEYPSFSNIEYARAAVRMEIRLETAMEGNRFFDLRRWGIDDEVLNEFISNDLNFRSFMQGAVYNPEKDDYWPLPQTQIDLQNNILIQDPAY